MLGVGREIGRLSVGRRLVGKIPGGRKPTLVIDDEVAVPVLDKPPMLLPGRERLVAVGDKLPVLVASGVLISVADELLLIVTDGATLAEAFFDRITVLLADELLPGKFPFDA